jgi:methylenetetrahydrofolate dehydrogenase (NADP+)/methenyltetrahydrofolate cyclohydrolase
MAKIIDGKEISKQVRQELAAETASFKEENGFLPGLAVVIVGDDPASHVYVKNKARACDEVGFYSETHELPAETTQEELEDLIDRLNAQRNQGSCRLKQQHPNRNCPNQRNYRFDRKPKI